MSQSFFSEILEHAIAEVSQVANTALAFVKVQEVAQIPTRFWDQLVQKASKESESLKKYQIDLLKHASESSSKMYLESIVKSIYSQCGEYINNDGSRTNDFDALQFYQSISRLDKELRNHDYLAPLLLLSPQKTSPELFVQFVNAAKEEYSNYEISCSIEEIDTYLSALSVNDLKDMQTVKYIPSDDKRKLIGYEKSLKTAIGNSNDLTEAEIFMNRWVDLDLYDKDLMSDSIIEDLFSDVKENSLLYYCLICLRLARGTSYSYSSMDSILSEENDKLTIELAKYIHLFITYSDLLLMYQNMEAHPLYKSLVRYLVSKQLGKSLSIEKVLPLYKKIASSLDITVVDLLTDWDRWRNLLERTITKETIRSIPIEFFEDTQELQHLQIVSYCREVGKKYLQSIPSDKWKEHFSKENNEYQLLMSLGSDCPNAYEAFKQTIKSELEDQNLKLSDSTYKELKSLFEKQRKKWGSVFQGVRDRYGEMGIDITNDLFKRYGVPLIDRGKLSENQNAIRSIIPTILLMDVDSMKILIARGNELVKILNSAEDEYRQEFVDMVVSRYEVEPSLRSELKVLASVLKIKIPSEDDKAQGHS